MTPLKVNASPLVVTPIALLLLPNVMPPLTVFAEPEVLTSANAPALLIPVPLSVIAFGMLRPLPLIANSAPLAIVAVAVLAPNPALFETVRVPVLILVVPVYVLVPERASVPAPPLLSVMLEPLKIQERVNTSLVALLTLIVSVPFNAMLPLIALVALALLSNKV